MLLVAVSCSYLCVCSWWMLAIKSLMSGTSLAVQWLGLRASIAGGTGSILGRGTKILLNVGHTTLALG